MDNSVARDSAPAIRRERAKAPVHVRLFGDRIFNVVTFVLALFILALLFGLAIALIVSSFPAIRAFGLHFFVSSTWDPVQDQYGALPFIYGTFVSSFLALIIAVPLSLGVALCLSEMAPDWLSHRLGFLVDLLAAIPSVVYGLWAVFVMGPWIRDYDHPVHLVSLHRRVSCRAAYAARSSARTRRDQVGDGQDRGDSLRHDRSDRR